MCYLLIVRRYWQDLFIVISQLGLLRVFCCSAAIFFALLLAGCFAMIIMKMGILAPLVTMGLISGVYSCYKTVLKQSDLMWLFNVAIGYGLLLMVLTSSVLTYFLHQNQYLIDFFNEAYSSEPLASLLLGLVFAGWLLKWDKDRSREQLYRLIAVMNYVMPFVFLLYFIFISMKMHAGYVLLMMFVLFSLIEYMSQFCVRQIAQHEDYNAAQGAQMAGFYTIILNGLCPSLFYILIYICCHMTNWSLDKTVMISILLLIFTSICFNGVLRSKVFE